MTRYQFLSFAYFIDHDTFPPRFGRHFPPNNCTHFNETGHATCSPLDQPNVAMEEDWLMNIPSQYQNNAWRYYLGNMAGGVTSESVDEKGGTMRGRMECNCARVGKAPEFSENRLYEHPESGTVLSFNFELGWGDSPVPLQGFNFTNCSRTGTCRTSVERMAQYENRSLEHDFDWQQTFPEAIDKGGMLRTLLPKPDITLYNRGIWGLLEDARAQKILPVLYDWVGGDQGGRCYYKSTTGAYNSLQVGYLQHERRWIRLRTHQAGCSYIDNGYLTDIFAAMANEHKYATERKFVFTDAVRILRKTLAVRFPLPWITLTRTF